MPCTASGRSRSRLTDQSADYLLALKANQDTLNDDGPLLLADPATPVAQDSHTNKGHGRVETRTARVSDDVVRLQETHQWPGLKAVGKIIPVPFQDGQTSTDERHYFLSQPCAPERFNEIVRSHWGIENEGLHVVLAPGRGINVQRGPGTQAEGALRPFPHYLHCPPPVWYYSFGRRYVRTRRFDRQHLGLLRPAG